MAKSGAEELSRRLNGIARTFETKAGTILAAKAYGFSLEEIPYDTGHMRQNTELVPVAEGTFEMRTDTDYAYDQYTKTRLHYWDGQYRSISRANVPLSEKLRSQVKSRKLRGSFARQEVYREKYEYLKAAGMLYPRKPEWFHKGVRKALDGAIVEMKQAFVALARSQARAGTYYTTRV